MYCSKCGTKNKTNSNYCYKCGNSLSKMKISNNTRLDDKQKPVKFLNKIAYNIHVSENKYTKIFYLVATAVVSFAFFVAIYCNVPEYFSDAINVSMQSPEIRYSITMLSTCEKAWRNVWCSMIFMLMTAGVIICDIIIFIKVQKINKPLHKKEKIK